MMFIYFMKGGLVPMKPFKQSNSMKELLNKLKRHDTLVMAIGVVTATILCGAFVYVTTPAISADAAAKEVRKDSLGVQKKTNDQLNEIGSYLERLDSVVTGSQELMQEIQSVQSKQSETINNSTAKENNTNNTKVVEKISGLDKELEAIHTEIRDAATLVKNMSESIEKGEGKGSDKEKTGFTQINNALSDIKRSCDDSSVAVSGLVAELKNSKKDNDKTSSSVLGNLEKIEKKLQDVNPSENLSRMERELLSTQSTYMILMKDMEKKVDKGVSDIEKNVTNVDTSVNQVLETQKKAEADISGINTSVGNVNSNIESINQKLGELSEKLDQSFKKVTSEKDKLASTLVTLGVDIKEKGATFAELDDAIKKLPNLVLKNAKFTYTRHEHVDKNNNIVKGELCTTKGGCFTVPSYHVHSSSCFYNKKMIAMYFRMMYTLVSQDMSALRSNQTCPYCKKVFAPENMNHDCMCEVATYNAVNSQHPEYIQYQANVRETTQYTQRCTKSTTAVEGYAPSCKYHSGEILSAEIDFTEDDANIQASHVMNSKDEIYDGKIISSRRLSLEEILKLVEEQREEEADNDEAAEEISEEAESLPEEETADEQDNKDKKEDKENKETKDSDKENKEDSSADEKIPSGDEGDKANDGKPEEASDEATAETTSDGGSLDDSSTPGKEGNSENTEGPATEAGNPAEEKSENEVSPVTQD